MSQKQTVLYIFTCAQRQYDLASGYGDNDRYYYGDLVINFNRYISNPILHIAGLGGSYRYFPVGAGNINNPALWRSAYFSTELQVVGFNLSKVSGNDNLNVPAGTGSILNSATTPNGGSVDPTTNDIFNDYGAASGSVRIIGTVKLSQFKFICVVVTVHSLVGLHLLQHQERQ